MKFKALLRFALIGAACLALGGLILWSMPAPAGHQPGRPAA